MTNDQIFSICNAVRSELSWSHYNALSRIENPNARLWYQQEAITQNWSVRALSATTKDYLRDLYILDFLNLQDKTYQESDLEHGIISNLQQFLLELGKGEDDNPTIGLVLCSEKSEAVVKYSVLTEQKQLFAAKYLPYLPSEEELKQELERERERVQQALIEQQKELDDEL